MPRSIQTHNKTQSDSERKECCEMECDVSDQVMRFLRLLLLDLNASDAK